MNGRSASQQGISKNPPERLPGGEGPGDHPAQPSHFGDRETGPGNGRAYPSHSIGPGEFFFSDTDLLSANPLLRGWGWGREGLKEKPPTPGGGEEGGSKGQGQTWGMDWLNKRLTGGQASLPPHLPTA